MKIEITKTYGATLDPQSVRIMHMSGIIPWSYVSIPPEKVLRYFNPMETKEKQSGH
jgi:hypothetical protein